MSPGQGISGAAGAAPRRVLVTGGAGFIGSHVADALVAQGHSVAVIDDLSTGKAEFVPSRATFLSADIASKEAADFIADWRPDAVAHLAAQVSVRDSVADPVQDARTNVLGSIALFEACRKAGTTRIVFASTGGAMYGLATRLPTPETEPPTPLSPYGCAKLAVEGYLGYFARVHRMKACALRFANVYGPRQSPHGEAGVVAIFAARYLRKEVPTIHGDGSQTRDYVHVSDVARAMVGALAAGLEGVFNVGTGVETSTLRISEHVRAAALPCTPARHGPERAGDALRSSLDATALARAIGWHPMVDAATGLRSTVDWFRGATPVVESARPVPPAPVNADPGHNGPFVP